MLKLNDCMGKLVEFKSHFGEKFGIVKLGIFGSVARADNTEDSDIDIVVELKNPNLVTMYELEQQFKSMFNCNVDLVRYRQSLRTLLKTNIEKDVKYV